MSNICPNCLSTLKISKTGGYECTGNKLAWWINTFKMYQVMTLGERETYLDIMSDKDAFLELYIKWAFIDSNGVRSNFGCDYSHTAYSPVNRLRMKIKDPAAVRSKERILGRPLTNDELRNIPTISFPDEV